MIDKVVYEKDQWHLIRFYDLKKYCKASVARTIDIWRLIFHVRDGEKWNSFRKLDINIDLDINGEIADDCEKEFIEVLLGKSFDGFPSVSDFESRALFIEVKVGDPVADGGRQPVMDFRPCAESPELGDQLPKPESHSDRPLWNSGTRTLSFKCWKKKYRRGADRQIAILDQFQTEGWPEATRFSDAQILATFKETVKSLQQTFKNSPLMFERDGSTKGIIWSENPSYQLNRPS